MSIGCAWVVAGWVGSLLLADEVCCRKCLARVPLFIGRRWGTDMPRTAMGGQERFHAWWPLFVKLSDDEELFVYLKWNKAALVIRARLWQRPNLMLIPAMLQLFSTCFYIWSKLKPGKPEIQRYLAIFDSSAGYTYTKHVCSFNLVEFKFWGAVWIVSFWRNWNLLNKLGYFSLEFNIPPLFKGCVWIQVLELFVA